MTPVLLAQQQTTTLMMEALIKTHPQKDLLLRVFKDIRDQHRRCWEEVVYMEEKTVDLAPEYIKCFDDLMDRYELMIGR